MAKNITELDPNTKGKLYLHTPGSYKNQNTIEVFHGVKVKNVQKALRHRHSITSAELTVGSKRKGQERKTYAVTLPKWPAVGAAPL